MPQKRIAIVANTTWNIFNFRLNVIRRLLADGYEVTVLAPLDKFITYTEILPDVTHVPLRHLDRDSVNPFRDLQLFWELFRQYRRLQPDIVLHYTVKPNIYGAMAARLRGIPSLAVVTGLGYSLMHPGWINVVTRWLYKLSLRFHRQVIFENGDDRQLFESLGLVRTGQSVAVKGCGVDTRHFHPNGRLTAPDHVTFTFIGRLLYDKGIREFVEAAGRVGERHPQARFWIVGDIDRENPSAVRNEDLVRWIRHPRIHYHGSTDDIRQVLAQTDCVVLPSYREGMPRVIMEAMAMERPVITTDTAGCRETVDDGVTGYLVQVQDTDTLSLAMERFLALDEAARQTMGRSGREKALREFDDRLIAEQLTDMIRHWTPAG